MARAKDDATANGAGSRGNNARGVGAQGAKTRGRLLEAARKAFAERGYPATRVDDITQGAGTSHGAFYLYFANKQDIMEALAVETSERMFALADELEGIERGEDGYEHLRKWVAAFTDAYMEDAPVVTAWAQAAEEARFARFGFEVLGKFAAKIAHAIQRSVDADDRHPIDANIAATALVAMLERFSYFWLLGGAPFERDAVIDSLAALCYEAIFGAPPGR